MMNGDPNLLQSQLKQQCINDEGLYNWQKKLFTLHVNQGLLEITAIIEDNVAKGASGGAHSTTTTTSTVHVSLKGAKYAKEWSFNSALTGYGFDIFWASDNQWSFLAEEENICHAWVDKLNKSIDVANNVRGSSNFANNGSKHNSVSFNGAEPTLQQLAALPLQQPGSIPNHLSHYQNHAMPQQLMGFISGDAAVGNPSEIIASKAALESHKQFLTGRPPNDQGQHLSQQNNHQLLPGKSGNIEEEGPIRLESNHPLYRQYNNNASQPFRDRYANHSMDEDIPPPPPPNNSFALRGSEHQGLSHQSFHNISAIPNTDSGSEASNQDRHDSKGRGTSNPDTSFQYSRHLPPTLSYGETRKTSALSNQNGIPEGSSKQNRHGDEFFRDMRTIFEDTKKTIVTTENELNSLRNSNDVISLQIKCQQLEKVVDEKEHALEIIQNNTSMLAQQYQEQVSVLQEELEMVKRREEDIAIKFQKEIDDHLVRASNENNSFYDATIKNLKIQHGREISLLQDELADERRKHQQAFEKELHFRKKIEEDERHAKSENNRLLDRISVLEFELQQVKDSHNQLALAADREKRRMQLEYDQKIHDLQSQLDETQRDAEKAYQTRLIETRNKYETTIRNIKEKELELLKQEVEGDRIRCLLEYQKKCELDIETARTEERKLAAVEVEKVRQAFIQREQRTAKDLMDLEKLHAKRVDQLEEAISAEQKKYQGLKEEYQQTSLAFERKLQDLAHQIQQLHDKNHDSVMINDALQREMKAMNERVEDRSLKEVHYREELSKALTELRLLQAEKLELSNQSSQSNAQSLQWRQMLQDQESRYAAMDAQLKITREENSMLEHEAARLRQENESLKQELEKCDRLIYGVSQHRVDQKKSIPIVIEPSSFGSSSSHINHGTAQKHSNRDAVNVSFASSSTSAPSLSHIPMHQSTMLSGPSPMQRTSNFIDFLNNTHSSLISSNFHQQPSSSSPTAKKTPRSISVVGNSKKASPPTSSKPEVRYKRSSSPTTFNPYHSQEMTISRAAKLPISQSNIAIQDQDIISLMRKNKQILSR